MSDELLTRAELQAMLKVSRATLYRLMADGLPCIGTGRLRRFDREAILRWWGGPETEVDGQGAAPSPATAAAPTPPMVVPGVYRCARCGGTGAVRYPMHNPRCPRCQDLPHEVVRVGDLPGAG